MTRALTYSNRSGQRARRALFDSLGSLKATLPNVIVYGGGNIIFPHRGHGVIFSASDFKEKPVSEWAWNKRAIGVELQHHVRRERG